MLLQNASHSGSQKKQKMSNSDSSDDVTLALQFPPERYEINNVKYLYVYFQVNNQYKSYFSK